MTVRCAIYTRKSTEEGLEQDFNSLDAQREACEAYVQSQRSLGWKALPKKYDDGGISGGILLRPALKDLLSDIEADRIDLVVVYKVDRLTRSLMDFSKIIETFDAKDVSFVSVTQQFNTANSMGRLTLNMLLSFAQFEREVTAERIRDKIAASKRKGMWMGGPPPLGYDVCEKKLVVNETEAIGVRKLFALYLELGSVRELKAEADRLGITTKRRIYGDKETGGKPFMRGNLYCLLHNPLYVGKIAHKGEVYPGQHEAIVDEDVWNRAQKLLSEQAPDRRSKSNTDRRCMLTGLVFDETGDRLCPTYAKNNGRIHAYYVSKRLMPSGSDNEGGWRLPAKGLEKAVVRAITEILDDEKAWIKLLSANELTSGNYMEAQDKIAHIRDQLASGQIAEVRNVIRGLVHRITIEPGKTSIVFVKGAPIAQPGDNESVLGYEYCISFQTRRRGVETRIVFGGKNPPEVNRDQNLIAAVKRSFRWWKLLTEEDGWSIQKLAEQDRMDASDVTRFLPLAFLAPDVVEAILDGRQPEDLTLERLKKMGSLPMAWEEQVRVLGFA